MLRNPCMRALGLTMLLVVSCRSEAPVPDTCLEPPATQGIPIARIGRTVLDDEELVTRVLEQGAAARRRFRSDEALRTFVEDQIRFELLVRSALEHGLARDPDVVRAAHKVMVRKLLQRELDPKLEDPTVGEAAIAAYYADHKNDYRQPEMRRIAHIQLAPTEDGRAEAQSLIATLAAKGGDAALFRRLAQRHSQDAESVGRGGELAFATQDELVERYGLSFAARVFALGPGAVTDKPVQSKRGWHVVRLVAVREAWVRALDAVRDEIRDRLQENARTRAFDKYLAAIRERYPVSFDAKRLGELRARIDAAAEVSSR